MTLLNFPFLRVFKFCTDMMPTPNGMIRQNDYYCIPWILSPGSFVCPAIDRSLFCHGIYGDKVSIVKTHNIPELVLEKQNIHLI